MTLPVRMRLGLGCMRLSTAADRSEERAIAVIHAALDAGVTLLDTADAYCRDDQDVGHNERLVAAALRTWHGDLSTITVATKGGMRRPRGEWVPDGRAKHLRAACEASRAALGVERIALYQLHAVDPATPLETSVRALAALQRDGLVDGIGLCNVTVAQIRQAREIAPIAAVQVAVSPLDDTALRNGVAEYCRDEGISLIAHRPLGGDQLPRLRRNNVLARVAMETGVTIEEVALAWLMSFDDAPVPIPGATRVESAASLARALSVELSPAHRDELDAQFGGRLLRTRRAQRRPASDGGGEVVVIMGMPGSGKSWLAREHERDGFLRLNRDALGGSLRDLVPRLDAALAAGARAVVLDNTYPSRASRNEVIECAWEHGLPVRCVWIDATIGDAQVNAIYRMVEVHGTLPSPEQVRELGRRDPRYLLPDALFRFERQVEPPTTDEGFVRVDRRPARRAQIGGASRGLFIDANLLTSANVDLDSIRQRLAEGWLLHAHAWRPGMSADAAAAEKESLQHALPVPATVDICVHPPGPPVCWCRKPIPGHQLAFAIVNRIDLARSTVIGHSPADRTLAERLGARYEGKAGSAVA